MADVTTTEQIVREAPDIEAYKLGLLDLAKKRAQIPVDIPDVKVAGQTPEQIKATALAQQGIGSYQPFLNTASDLYGSAAQGYGTVPSYGTSAVNAVQTGGNAAVDLALQGAQAYNPNSAQNFMNPYQQAVTDQATKEMQRNAAIQQAQNQAQGVKAGAFGGSRQGVQTSELARNLADIQSKRIFEDYSTNYSQAQTAAMNAFQNQQSRLQQAGNTALGAGTALGQANISAGQLNQGASAGLASLGTSTANLGQLTSGLGQGDVSFLYNMGTQNQNFAQKGLDATRANDLQAAYEPFQRISFLSDIYKGAPSSQQTISQATSPSPSILSQAGGLGIAGLAAYNLFGGKSGTSAGG